MDRQEASTGRARRGRALSVLAGVALFALWATPALAAQRVYWANYGDPMMTGQPGSISFANLDGSGGGQLNIIGTRSGNPNGVAIDLTTNKIYWADRTNNTIWFAKLDGTGGGQLNTSGATLSAPRGVAIDPAAHKIYWTNFDNDTISFANDNGSGGGGQLNTTGASLNHPQGLAIDHASSRVYWSNQGNPKAGQPGSISFARLNGSGGGGQLNTTGAMVYSPTGVAIDRAANRIYWANQYVNTISFVRLDGSGGGGQLNTRGATLHYPVGPAIDPVTRKIYWANVLNDTISFARLDGSGGGQLNTSRAPLNHPNFPALLYACVVPRLNGKTLARARRLLKKGDCRLGKVRPKGRMRGIVHRQRPRPGRIVPAGSTVDVGLR